MIRYNLILVGILLAGLLLPACAPLTALGKNEPLVVYSGRSENLVGPIIEQFETASGIDVEVRWGGTGELAAAIQEEGERSPADVFFAQDPGGLGAVEDQLSPLPESVLNLVDAAYRDPQGRWIGVSGRARTLVYNTQTVSVDELPEDIIGLTDPRWKGRIGWAPTNASFQTMVTAMRVLWGEERTQEWLNAMKANEPVVFESNAPIVAAVGAGEIDLGLVNHYYLYRFLQEEGESFPARNYYFPSGGPESLVMMAGVGVLESSDRKEDAQKLVQFLLSPVAQQYFATQTYEYPLVEGVVVNRDLPALDTLHATDIELSQLADLPGTVELLRETGVLP